MHEYGLVQSLLSLVDQSVRDSSGTRATRVVVTVGGMDGEHQRFFREAFDTFKAETTTVRDAELVLDPAPPGVREIYLQSVEIEV